MIRNRLNRERIYSTADYWNSKVEDYAGDAVSMWPNNHLNGHYHREQIEFLGTHLSNLSGYRVLDVGCGTGRISRHLAACGAQVVGVDFAAKAVEVAQRACSGTNPTFRVQSMFAIEDRQAYDLITSWGSLAIGCRRHEDLVDVIGRLFRALKPGGRMLLLEPIHASPLRRVLKMGTFEFCRVMQEVGFSVQSVQPLHFWPARIALAYLPWPKLITTPCFHAGQGLMHLLGNRPCWGDYKGIDAIRPA